MEEGKTNVTEVIFDLLSCLVYGLTIYRNNLARSLVANFNNLLNFLTSSNRFLYVSVRCIQKFGIKMYRDAFLIFGNWLKTFPIINKTSFVMQILTLHFLINFFYLTK